MMHQNPFLYAAPALLIHIAAAAGCASAGPAATPAPAASPAPAGTGAAVAIKNFAFSPATLAVPAGTTVVWTNEDSASPAIVSDERAPAAFPSDTLGNGDTCRFAFTGPGTYPYHCTIHPPMTGTIVVSG
jgi:plastocyanin